MGDELTTVSITFPRDPSAREAAWLEFLLPADRLGYAAFRERLDRRIVLGEGRWGRGDLWLGRSGQEIDRGEGIQPTVAYGEILVEASSGTVTITLSLHQPNPDDMIEFQTGVLGSDAMPDEFVENSRWSYSYWSPGNPCPATGKPVRQIVLNEPSDLLLVISPAKRSLWLHDGQTMMNTLVPVTNFYNEIMLLKGIRDPHVALDHRLLFSDSAAYTDAEIRETFVRYNMQFRKVDTSRLERDIPTAEIERSFMKKIFSAFGGKR